MRGCFGVLGLAALLAVGSCMMTGAGIWRMANPTHFTQNVDETPDRARRLLRGFLEVAQNEGPADRGLGAAPTTLSVQDYDDGSVRLLLNGKGARLLEIIATFRAREDGSTDVDVYSDATRLTPGMRPRIYPATVHRQIRTQLKAALNDIDRHRVVAGGFLISRMISNAQAGGETIRRMP